MIRKLNIFLIVTVALMFAMKGIKEFKASRAKADSDVKGTVERQESESSDLAPHVYYGYWAGYTVENPISNRNGVLLDIIRAIFPKAEFRHVHGEVKDFMERLQSDPQAVLLGFGEHPLLKDNLTSPMPILSCPMVIMTLRSNPWRYKDFSSLTNLRIVADESFLDYKVLRKLKEIAGNDSDRLRIMSATITKEELAEMVENGAADAFVMADMDNTEGAMKDSLTSVRILHNFRKSQPIGAEGTRLYVSTLNPEFGRRVVKEYEAGMRRIDSDGQRRRIFEYYGIPYEPLPPAK